VTASKFHPSDENAGIEPFVGDKFAIDHVEEIHGSGSRPCEEYRPTVHEVDRLARSWVEEVVALEWAGHFCVGSCDRRLRIYAYRRLDHIAGIIGVDRVEGMFKEEKEKFSEDWNPVERQTYLEGTDDDIWEMSDRMHESLNSLVEIDFSDVMVAISEGTPIQPVTVTKVQETTGGTTEQVWREVCNLVMRGRMVCFDVGIAMSGLDGLAFWLEKNTEEYDRWIQGAWAFLERAMDLKSGLKRHVANRKKHEDSDQRGAESSSV
jgi:hypothetical protein